MWVDKYKPLTSRDLIGNQTNATRIAAFLKDWKKIVKQKTSKKALLLSGPPGIGKTSAAHVIAKYVFSTFFHFMFFKTKRKRVRSDGIQCK